MEWLNNLNEAIKYIEKNLTEEISYEKAAMIAGCSTSYFQRLFTYISGISLSEYIRRRRMTQAAFDLQTGQMKVIDVALKYGYESPSAFNRAFKSVHGITPVAARENNTKLSSFLPIMLSVNVSGGKNMPYQIEEKDKIQIEKLMKIIYDNPEIESTNDCYKQINELIYKMYNLNSTEINIIEDSEQ